MQEESSDGPWWDVYSVALHADDPDTDLRWEQPRWLLQPADVGLGQLAAWLDKVEQLGPLPAVVADLAHVSTISLDTQVLLLATVAEGLHRRLYPDDRRFDKQTGKDVQAVAAAAVSLIHPEAEASVRGLLNHVEEVGYTRRLARLAEAVKDAVPGVTGNTSKWKAVVFEARNEYSHRLSIGFLDGIDIDRRQTVTF